MAWDLLFGFAGEVNFGPSFLIGPRRLHGGAAEPLRRHGRSRPAWSPAPRMAVIGGVVLAVPALRLRGPYFGLVTLVAVLLLQNVIVLFAGITGGEIGLDLPDVLVDRRQHELLVRARLHGDQRRASCSACRAPPAGLILQASRPGRRGGRGARLQRRQAQAGGVLRQRAVLRPRRRHAGFLPGHRLGRHRRSISRIGVQFIIAAVLGGRRTIIGAAIGSIFLIVAGEIAAPARPAFHLRRLRDRAGGDPVLPRRLPRRRCWPRRQRE